jgi:methyl-accepting chemotaxis protein
MKIKIKLKLYVKMLILILSTSVLIFGASILVISLNIKGKAYENSTEYADMASAHNSTIIQGYLQKFMNTSKGLSNILLSYGAINDSSRRSDLQRAVKSVLAKNEDFLAVWTIWEPYSIDELDSIYINVLGNTYEGNFSPTYYRTNAGIELESLSTGPLYQGNYYTIPKETHRQTLLEPYYYSYEQEKGTEILQTNMIVPLMEDGDFLGVVGTDASLANLQEFSEKIKPFENSYAFLIASNGTIVAHQNSGLVGKKFDTLTYQAKTKEEIIEELRWKGQMSFTDIDPLTGENSYFTMNQVVVGDALEKWIFGIAVPVSELNEVANKSFTLSVVTGLVALVIFTVFIYLISRSISRPVVEITKVVQQIALGNIDQKLRIKANRNDEISDMANSVNRLIDGLNRTAEFAKEIGEGNLDSEHQLLGKNDHLGRSLVDMRESLKKARKFERRKREEDEKQSWVTQGLARFGEIMREDNDDMARFSLNIAKNLCEYMQIPQSAIFIKEEEENKVYYELKALYAYGSQKLYDKKVYEGEEVVGRSISEKKTIYLKDTPERFATITTGNTNDPVPNQLLIVPMLMNDVPFGVMELMAEKPFEPHHIEFAENVAVIIASTVSSVKTNIRTAQLLKQSEDLKDVLSQQEEEMRQNLEEMEATQEEAKKRENELSAIRDSLRKITMMAEYDLEGRIIRINKLLANAYGHAPEHMVGKFQDAFVTQDNSSRRNFLKFWQEVAGGVTKKRIHEIVKRGETIYLNETYIPIVEDDRVDRVLNITIDITNKVKLDKEITQLMNKVGELKNS